MYSIDRFRIHKYSVNKFLVECFSVDRFLVDRFSVDRFQLIGLFVCLRLLFQESSCVLNYLASELAYLNWLSVFCPIMIID